MGGCHEISEEIRSTQMSRTGATDEIRMKRTFESFFRSFILLESSRME